MQDNVVFASKVFNSDNLAIKKKKIAYTFRQKHQINKKKVDF